MQVPTTIYRLHKSLLQLLDKSGKGAILVDNTNALSGETTVGKVEL